MYQENDTVTMSKSELAALIEHSSKDDARPHICAVYFDLPACYVVSTDGHRLARARCEGNGTVSFLVARDTLETVAKAIRAGGDAVISQTRAIVRDSFQQTKLEIPIKPVGARFPPYQAVIPAFDLRHAGVPFRVDVRVLAGLIKVQAAAGDSYGLRMFPPQDPKSPTVWTSEGNAWLVVTMPMFGRNRDSDLAPSLEKCTNLPRSASAA